MPPPEAAAMRAQVDAHARAAEGGRRRAADRPAARRGAARPGDRAPGQDRPAVSAHLRGGRPAGHAGVRGGRGARGGPGAGAGRRGAGHRRPGRALLERLDALCPGGLQAPTDGTLSISITDAGGRLLATLTRRELESAVPARAAGWARRRRSTATSPPRRSGGSPHPGPHLPASRLRQPGRLGRPGPRDRARRRRGDRLRQPVLPVPPAPPAEDPRPRLALRHDARRRPAR